MRTPRYYRSRHKLLPYYRRLMLAGLLATVAVAVALQPRHGSPVGAAATWTHVAAVAPICWLWLTHPRFAVRLLFAALAGTVMMAVVAGGSRRLRYR